VAKFSNRNTIIRRVKVLLIAVLDEVFLAKITASPNASTPSYVAGKCALVVFLAHVLGVC
jgi:hypothetical protein